MVVKDIRLDRDGLGTRESKVSELELASRIDEQVLGLQVPVKNLLRVTKRETTKQLVVEKEGVVQVAG